MQWHSSQQNILCSIQGHVVEVAHTQLVTYRAYWMSLPKLMAQARLHYVVCDNNISYIYPFNSTHSCY